jgi:hypothetical protein
LYLVIFYLVLVAGFASRSPGEGSLQVAGFASRSLGEGLLHVAG